MQYPKALGIRLVCSIKKTADRFAGSVAACWQEDRLLNSALKHHARNIKVEADILSPCMCFDVILRGLIHTTKQQQV
jgi:hypothetical protein